MEHLRLDSSPPPPPPSEMAMELGSAVDESAAAWEWGSLLDFSIDDDVLSWPDHQIASPPPVLDPTPANPRPPDPPADGLPRVRKRDPRLVCQNYLAGRVPCACPEMDEMEVEEPEVAVGARKKVRVGGAAAAGGGAVVSRCQVPGCEADISELKGYHRRHRVCLRCATASSVLLDGQHKRYCQQCGKFHILPDFDEGRRSCRRKLEKHNKRRRRRPSRTRSVVEEERVPKEDLLAGEPMKEMLNGFACEAVETVVSNKIMDTEAFLESETGHGSPMLSLPSFQNVHSKNVVSFTSSGDAQIDERVDNPKSSLSSTLCDRSDYSSVCPTGRISFKLYDWNPAEFPRRLRHQIFQWLASMPVELEGYIRPGCTILTVFIAMPHFMWEKLSEEADLFVRDLINAPESLLFGRGKFFIYLSNKIVQVMRDGTSLMNIKMDVQVPRLHYVYPTIFEAGKSMEFVACGSNLDQPKFRFLVSFSGKYLDYDSCFAISHQEIRSNDDITSSSVRCYGHEMFRISITRTEADVLGPAFIEVENESGISNFIPILLGNRHICSELKRIQEAFCKSLSDNGIMSQIAVNGASPAFSELLVSEQTAFSDLLLDIGWLLKEPCLDKNETILSSYNIQRLCSLLEFLIQNESVSILEEILTCLDKKIAGLTLNRSVGAISDADWILLQRKIKHARKLLCRTVPCDSRLELNSRSLVDGVPIPHRQSAILSFANHDEKMSNEDGSRAREISASHFNDENAPFVIKDTHIRRHCFTHLGMQWPQKSLDNLYPGTVTRAHIAIFVLVGVATCFGACIALFHPQKAGEFAVTVRRCLFGATVSEN